MALVTFVRKSLNKFDASVEIASIRHKKGSSDKCVGVYDFRDLSVFEVLCYLMATCNSFLRHENNVRIAVKRKSLHKCLT